MFEGNINMLGNFEECHRSRATYEYINVIDASGIKRKYFHDFDGKYCRIYWSVSKEVCSVDQ